MASNENPCDGGESGSGGAAEDPYTELQASSKLIRQTQANVDQITGIMKVSVDKAHERGRRLSELDEKATALDKDAERLQTQTSALISKHLDQSIPREHYSSKLQQSKAQMTEMTEVQELMRVNVEKVHERGSIISHIDETADALNEDAELMEKQVGALKSKYL